MNLLASLRRRARAFKNANMPFSNSSSLADAKFSFLTFYTPYFSHSAYSTLFVSHTPHFPYSLFSIFLIFHIPIFHTHHFPYSTFSKFLLFQSGFSRWEKNLLSSRQCKLTGKTLKSSNFSHWRLH